MLKCSPEFVKPCPLEAAMSSCLFLLFQWSKRQKLMSGYHSPRSEVPSHPEAGGRRNHRDTRRTGQSNKRGIYEPPAQPKSALWSKATAVGIGPRRPGSPVSPPPARGAQRPWAPGARRAGPPPPVSLASARILCSAAPLPAAAAPALPGARKAGIRCYHNKLNCSQQGPDK